MKKIIFFFWGLLCSLVIYAQKINTQKLDSLLKAIEINHQGMGSIIILKKNVPQYYTSIGYADISSQKRANEATKYRMGSISKTYTATIMMQMVDDNKLSLNTLLSDFFPKIPNAHLITIEDLLRHQSGLYNITNVKNLRSWVTKRQSRKQMLHRFTQHAPDFAPKEKTSYSNTNYILLSYIAEKVDRIPFAKIVKRRITKPLALQNTLFGIPINSKKNHALPYYFEDQKWQAVTTKTHLSAPMGAGGMVASTKDIALFYTNLFQGKVVSEASLKAMTNTDSGMGLGMSSINFKGLKVYGHDGGIDGFSSFALHIPKKEVTVAITLNGGNTSMLPLVISILEIYFENDPSLKKVSSLKLSSKDLDPYLGVYTSTTFPADVTITKKGTVLFAQATGQPLFKLVAEKKDVFSYDAIGIHF
jgi:D-alanyl-D-alanine carboxypeptidase